MKLSMYKYFLLFLLVHSVNAFGQEVEVYLNNELEPITKAQYYHNIDKSNYLYQSFATDSALVNIKINRAFTGQISASKLDTIKNIFKNDIKNESTIVIRYHTTLDDCYTYFDKNINHSYFQRKIRKLKNVYLGYVLNQEDNLLSTTIPAPFVLDKKSLIKDTFFEHHYICGSYVIIDEDGNYYASRGEYNPKSILEQINPKTGVLLYIENPKGQDSKWEIYFF